MSAKNVIQITTKEILPDWQKMIVRSATAQMDLPEVVLILKDMKNRLSHCVELILPHLVQHVIKKTDKTGNSGKLENHVSNAMITFIKVLYLKSICLKIIVLCVMEMKIGAVSLLTITLQHSSSSENT